MKTLLFMCIVLLTITGCSRYYTSSNTSSSVSQPSTKLQQLQQLLGICQQGNKQACHTLFAELKVACDYQYNTEHCTDLAAIYFGNDNLGVAFDEINIGGIGNRLTGIFAYTTKACMLGNVSACQNLEIIKQKVIQMAKQNKNVFGQ